MLVEILEHVYARMLGLLYAYGVDEPAQDSLDCCESVCRLVLILVIESLEIEGGRRRGTAGCKPLLRLG